MHGADFTINNNREADSAPKLNSNAVTSGQASTHLKSPSPLLSNPLDPRLEGMSVVKNEKDDDMIQFEKRLKAAAMASPYLRNEAFR